MGGTTTPDSSNHRPRIAPNDTKSWRKGAEVSGSIKFSNITIWKKGTKRSTRDYIGNEIRRIRPVLASVELEKVVENKEAAVVSVRVLRLEQLNPTSSKCGGGGGGREAELSSVVP